MKAEYLNPQVHLTDYIASLKAKLKADIAALKTKPSDMLSLLQTLKSKYYIHPLSIGAPQPTEPVARTEQRKHYEGLYDAKFFEIKVTIPYSGSKILFNCKPVTYTRVMPKHRHELYANLINVFIELDELDAEKYDRELQRFLSDITLNLERINTQVSFFNDELDDLIRSQLTRKSDELAKQADFMEKIGLNVNPKSNPFMVPPPIAKKAIPVPVTDVNRQHFTTVLETVRNSIGQHLQYKRFINATYSTSFAFELNLPADSGSTIFMEFMLFHFPDI